MTKRSGIWLLFRLLVVSATAVLLCSSGASAAQQSLPPIQITSPPDGTVVAPGETIKVVVTPAPNMTFTHVFIIGEDPIGFSEMKASPPFEIPVTIPKDIRPGRYHLTASGVIRPGRGEESLPITVNVEKPDPLVQLSVKPTLIVFKFAGEQMPLRVVGTFSDGATLTITESTFTKYSSNNSSVATVDARGLVEAVDDGETTITVTYKDKNFMVLVKVKLERLTVPIEIKPGEPHKTINLKSKGTVRVAILSTADFDATTVDVSSVRFGPAKAVVVHQRSHVEDVNHDGRPDLVLHFAIGATGLTCADTQASLIGLTMLGERIGGTATILPIGPACQ